MKMVKYYGYKVAVKPIDKNSRACYNKFYKNGAVVFDQSYQQVVVIKGDQENVEKGIFGEGFL